VNNSVVFATCQIMIVTQLLQLVSNILPIRHGMKCTRIQKQIKSIV